VAKRGRPTREWRWLVHDVDRVRAQRGGSVLDACAHLAGGGFAEILPISTTTTTTTTTAIWPEGCEVHRVHVVWGRWKGMRPETLERRYYEWKSSKNKFCDTA
jgi:hypothetical protein